ncbi:acyl carrier protein [Streptomyces gobiensis]|uniref:acyl carrier protein n=1 Tax=Streptomyces gobiensis TaxID=2875706 RepID=UPI001E64D063|nr:acyl carrier protein [Streptomyces gobiensis]UGY91467.1 acyl carrier protein [Streptomyces gobiensis]
MRSDQKIRDGLRSWVRKKATDHHGPAVGEITDFTPLFEERHLRSVHLPELLLLLERLCGSPIDVAELGPGDFRDIDTMVRRFGSAGVAR